MPIFLSAPVLLEGLGTKYAGVRQVSSLHYGFLGYFELTYLSTGAGENYSFICFMLASICIS